MNKLHVLALSAAGLLAATATAQAQKVLRVSSWAPPTHHINAEILPTWGKWIEEASNGRLKIKVEYDLAPPPRQFDVARDGIADIAWSTYDYTPGQFVLTKVVELPGLGASAEAMSVTLWRLQQKYEQAAAEHRDLVLLGVMAHGPGMIHTKTRLNTLADLKGMKIRIGGGVAAEVGKMLGVVGVQVPAPKVYETLSQGVADGVFFPIESKKSFRIYEVAPYTLIMPGGLYSSSFAFVMNPDSYESLSEEDREALLSVSGEKLSQMAGMWWDKADEAGMQVVKEAGNTVTEAGPEDAKTFDGIIAKLQEAWIEEAKARGVDGAAMLAEAQQIAREYDKQKPQQ